MSTHFQTPKISSNCQPKDIKKIITQEQKLTEIFSGQPLTMLQASRATSIERASICRWISKLRKEGTIYLIEKKIDHLTGFRAGYYTTDQTLKL